MAANNYQKIRVSALLLVFALILMLGVGNVKKVDAQDNDKICPQFCYDNLDYMTCRSTGSQKRTPSCNCCIAPDNDGCILYFTNGDTPIFC
ncbi:hypothetical protein BVRB_1g001380 [Beta vulgaris subsp. vulgaris]|nr:hypothetical protein BVRB_1g001380 [Beta vulgaris subsp. vulgaris]